MNLDRASEALRDAVKGSDGVEKLSDGTVRPQRRVGLLEIVQASVPPGGAREEALMALGRILGVADAMAGVKFKE